jgi:hypothetical protein
LAAPAPRPAQTPDGQRIALDTLVRAPSALSGKRKLYGARSSVPRSYRFAKVKRRLDGVIILSPSGRTGRPFPTDRLPAGTS